ncbi:MAG: alpha-D-glucose phosphate-specific phosphoglucomutase [Aeromicrobium sp.]|nr:MAG: alpha-D-glucose phosphate-specific phosphoglucomutase [Aeromicrobium sp.]
MTHPRAGHVALPEDLVDLDQLAAAYYADEPDVSIAAQAVSFGTSGHRGTSLNLSFNQHHIWAITQAICEVRASAGITGPLFLARDTHALSEPAWQSAIEVLIANDVDVLVDARDGFTPTPALSHAIIEHNRAHPQALADGIVVTPSHNPPRDGGFKYNPPHGGPADTDITNAIAARANELIREGLGGVRRVNFERARAACGSYDFLGRYVADLDQVVDMSAIAASGVRIGADPMGGASVDYWGAIAEKYRLNLEVVNPRVDPTFSFMTLDTDGKIRMDCSSANAMASLISMRTNYDIAFGNDADADRHGIVTPDGLMNPNHFLAVSIAYLFGPYRADWPAGAAIGKTMVSSSLIDRVAADRGRQLYEVPVGFKWFVDGLTSGAVGFGGEESAGSSFLRRDGRTWTTDKDGLIADLLAAEILATTGSSPSELHRELTDRLGDSHYVRVDAPASPELKARLGSMSPADVGADSLAGDAISRIETHAPGNGAPLGGVKVSTENSWFAARPSGTEDVQKIYAESFVSPEHLDRVIEEAQSIVAKALS